MKLSLFSVLTVIGLTMPLGIMASEKISLPLIPQMVRADIYVEPCKNKAHGTLVLCPGRNGNGQELIDGSAWGSFAKSENLNLVGLSFASNDDPQGRGYFNVSSGSPRP